MTVLTSSPVVDYFRLDEQLTAEERAIRDRVRTFAETDVLPIAQDFWDRADVPLHLVPGIARLGIVGGTIDGYGCPGISMAAYGLALQELSRADSSIATFVGVQSSLAMNAIYYCGTEEQRQRWLPPMARMETLGAFGLTEPDVGSDAANLRTTARLEGNTYILNGQKRWIGNGNLCDVAVIWAKTEDGKVNGFLVTRDTPGYDAQVITGKLSKRSIWQSDIELRDCRIPVENRLAGRSGFAGTATTLMHARLGVCWEALGSAIACYEIALNHARERHQFGRPIAGFQLVQRKLVEMLNGITMAQLAALHVSRLRDEGQLTAGIASLLKMNNTQTARQVVLDARDIVGGNGILGEYQIMRHLCDLEAVYTYEGTQDINMLVVGRDITGLSAFK